MPEQRKTKRINKILNVIISENPLQNGMLELLATCKNISRHGIQLELETAFNKGTPLNLRCLNNTNTAHIDIKCEVVWVAENNDKKLFNLGIRFVNFSEFDYVRLLDF